MALTYSENIEFVDDEVASRASLLGAFVFELPSSKTQPMPIGLSDAFYKLRRWQHIPVGTQIPRVWQTCNNELVASGCVG